MRRTLPALLLALMIIGLGQMGVVRSQQKGEVGGLPSPRLFQVMPAGAKAGATAEIALTGQDVDDADDLLFSVPGIKSERLAGTTVASAGPGMRGNPRGGNIPNQQVVRFRITVPTQVVQGIHDVRIVSRSGISNPRAFVLSDTEEVAEKEPNDDIDQRQKLELNSAVHGTLSSPTDVDYYGFTGKKGQRVVVSCLASSMDSKATPAIQLFAQSGPALAMSREYRDSDALLDAVLPADGDYLVRVSSFTYTQGGPEYFYRLSISTAPWIDAVFPPMIEPGKETKVTLYGRNLPGGQLDPSSRIDGTVLEKVVVSIKAPADPLLQQRLSYAGHVPPRSAAMDGFTYQVRNAAGPSNPYLIGFARAAVVLDNEANDRPDQAQEVALPCEIAGRIEKVGDRDWYRFTAKKGATFRIEVLADRLGSPIDMYLSLRSADGKVLVEKDDNPEILHPFYFYSRTDDPESVRFTVLADGTYLLLVASREADVQADPRHLYRVRITPEMPDFRLILMPTAPGPEGMTLRQAGAQTYSVLVARQDGFDGDITLSAEGLPKGVHCPAQVVGSGASPGTLALTADKDAPLWTGAIVIKGTANIGGQTVVREARAASISWPNPQPQQQQNVVLISRLDQSLALAVRERAPYNLVVAMDKATVTVGDKVEIPVKLERFQADFKGAVTITASNLPGNNRIILSNSPTLTPGKDEGKVTINVQGNTAPGVYSIVLRGQGTVNYKKDAAGKQTQNLTVALPATPLLLTVEPRGSGSGAAGTLAATPETPRLKAGEELVLSVRVRRSPGFTGDLKVTAVIPANLKGVKADEVLLPAGREEARLVIKADAKAEDSARMPILIRATGEGKNKKPVTIEGQITLRVSK